MFEELPQEDKQAIEQSYEAGQHLYFITAKNKVKIGRAMHPMGRLGIFQTGSPHTLKLVFVVPYAGKLVEGLVHTHLKSRGAHYRGEWFEYGAEAKQLIREMKQICSETGLVYNLKTNKVEQKA